MPKRREVPRDPSVIEQFQTDPQKFHRYYDVVVDAVEALQPLQRAVLEATFWERLSERKVAQTLQISRSAVRWHKKQGLLKLEKALEGVLDREDGN